MKQEKEQRIKTNKWIKAPTVKVIDEEGKFLGVMQTYEAIKLAQSKGVDLVEINGKVNPPLTQIIEVGKYKYEAKKKQAEAKKKQKVQECKELYFRPNTEEHDLNRQIDQARKFLEEGHQVRLVCKFRGRELAFQYLGEEKLKTAIESLADVMSFNTPISTDNKNMGTLISPKST
jgi:translation initiation factor IF-3